MSCVVLGPTGEDVPHLPVPAAVVSSPLAPILRMRQEPVSAMKRSPVRLKAMAAGLSSQASRAGVPSGAGLGVPPASVIRVGLRGDFADHRSGRQGVRERDVAVRVGGNAAGVDGS